MEAPRPLPEPRCHRGAGRLARGLRLGALILALLVPIAAPAEAAVGPGVLFALPGGGGAKIPASALAAEAPETVKESCLLRARPGEAPEPTGHRGLPVARALERYAPEVESFGHLTIPRPNGTAAYLPLGWFEGESPFEGCENALFSVDSGITKFFRPPLRGDPDDVNAEDNIATVSGEALTVGVHNGRVVEVRVTPSTTSTAAGSPVQFTAAVPGGGSFGFIWTFSDGATAAGESVSHAFSGSGTYEVRATALGKDESGGESAPLAIVVGNPPEAGGAGAAPHHQQRAAAPHGSGGRGGSGEEGGAGSGGTGTGRGPRSGSAPGRGASPERGPAPSSATAANAAPANAGPATAAPGHGAAGPVPTAPAHLASSAGERSDQQTVRGILVADTLQEPSFSASQPSAAQPGGRSSRPSASRDDGQTLPIAALLAVALLLAGALAEQRGLRFRLG